MEGCRRRALVRKMIDICDLLGGVRDMIDLIVNCDL